MDLSQYAELFLAESREHLSACNHLLLEWERNPNATEPVGGLFRAVHTIKGMAATMGYGRVADLAHRMENLLDQLRRGGKAPTDAVIQLLFRATDALEKSVTLAVAGREREADLTAILADIDRLGTKETPAPRRPEVPVTGEFPVAAAASGRLVNVQVRPEAPLKGGRAMLALRKAQALGKVHRVQPPAAVFESDDFDGHFVLELDTKASAEEIETATRSVGDIERVTVGGDTEDSAMITLAPSGTAGGGGWGGWTVGALFAARGPGLE